MHVRFVLTYQFTNSSNRAPRPLKKSGANEEYNLQLISKLANMEKNKICNSCENSKCEICALAHPEKVSVIYPTGQDITVLRNR